MRRPPLYPFWFLADKATEEELLYYAVHSQCAKIECLSTHAATGAPSRDMLKLIARRYRKMLAKLKP